MVDEGSSVSIGKDSALEGVMAAGKGVLSPATTGTPDQSSFLGPCVS
jgi:hypothetical protein